MRNFKVIIQYEGTRYQGWQKQGTTENTLQGKFETLLSRMNKGPVEIAASGRTDAGVHAYGQTANFWMDTKETPQALMEKINEYLPEDVAVVSCEEVSERFHSRLNAKGKTYRYRVLNSTVPHVFDRKFVWQVPGQLDLEAMKQAAALLVGTHDFKSFTSAKKSKKSTVRTITSLDIWREGDEVRFSFSGDGFLFHMVRILVGTLVEVGLSKRTAADMERIMTAGDRQEAGTLAPAQGLALMEVYYS